MPIIINDSTKVKNLYANETKQKKCYVNEETLVYSADEKLINGKEISEAITIGGQGFSVRRTTPPPSDGFGDAGCLEFRIGQQYWEEDHSIDGYLEFDFTYYDRLEMDLHYCGWTQFAHKDVSVGIDGNNTSLGNAGMYGIDMVVNRVYDISELTGTHRITFHAYLENESSETTSLNIGAIIRRLEAFA